MPEILKHKLKHWEVTYGYLGVTAHPEWRNFFKPVINKNFSLIVFGEEMFERKIDDHGRIYVGSAVKGLKAGETILIVRDEKGNFQVKREK